MLRRLHELITKHEDFAFETTLSTRSFVGLIGQAKDKGYTINLIFYWLDSVELAIERVKTRVAEGGHHIPTDVIVRRYHAGLNNFFSLYKEKVDYWMLIDNSRIEPELIAEGRSREGSQILNEEKWQKLLKHVDNDTDRDKG